MDSPLPSASLDHFYSIKNREEKQRWLYTPPPSLSAVAFSTITPKATGDGGVVKNLGRAFYFYHGGGETSIINYTQQRYRKPGSMKRRKERTMSMYTRGKTDSSRKSLL